MFKNTLDITKLYLKTTYGNRGVLISQLIMPLVFIFLIGQAIGGFGPGRSCRPMPQTPASPRSQ